MVHPDPRPKYLSPYATEVVDGLLSSSLSPSLAMRRLRSRYKSPCSLRNKVSSVRMAFEARSGREADPLLSLSREEAIACRRRQRSASEAKRRKNKRVDARPILSFCEEVLTSPSSHEWEAVCLCLLVVTGRRQIEILNGRSTFGAPSGRGRKGSEWWAHFVGQAKRRTGKSRSGRRHKTGRRSTARGASSSEKDAYDIPLLLPRHLVVSSLSHLRSRVDALLEEAGKGPASSLTNSVISNLLSARLGRARRGLAKVFSPFSRTHDLRAFYVAVVHATWDVGDLSLAGVAERVLGHARLSTSEQYTAFSATGIGRRRGGGGTPRSLEQ